MGSSTLACHPAITPYSYPTPLCALSGQEKKQARTWFLWGSKSGCDSELSPSQPYAQSADPLGLASLRRKLLHHHQAVYPRGGCITPFAVSLGIQKFRASITKPVRRYEETHGHAGASRRRAYGRHCRWQESARLLNGFIICFFVCF